MRAIKYGWLFCLSLLPFSAVTQNVMTSSPYSMFGVGEIMAGLHGANAGMGGVAIGMRGKMLINTDNPAGLAGLDTCRLFAEASAFAKWESYRSKGDDNQAFTGNFSRFAMAGRIMPRWYMAVGLTPYSSVGRSWKVLPVPIIRAPSPATVVCRRSIFRMPFSYCPLCRSGSTWDIFSGI